ncbi:MAG: DNA replication protein [Rhodospirillaceae bacterium]
MKAVQLPFEFGHRPGLEGADFLTAPCNAEAVAWLAAGRLWPAPALVLHGPAGSGKSHLARLWCRREGGMTVAAGALAAAAVPSLAGAGAAVVIDGAGAVAGDAGRERALFHLYNLIAERQGRLLLVAHEPVAGWRLGLADLASRLRAAPSVGIGAPDDAVLAALLVKLLADRQMPPPAEVVAFLVPRMERSFEAVRRLADALDRAALSAHRPITLPLARDVLAALT